MVEKATWKASKYDFHPLNLRLESEIPLVLNIAHGVRRQNKETNILSFGTHVKSLPFNTHLQRLILLPSVQPANSPYLS